VKGMNKNRYGYINTSIADEMIFLGKNPLLEDDIFGDFFFPLFFSIRYIYLVFLSFLGLHTHPG